MTDIYQTALRPLDCDGRAMKPLDLVIIKEVPEHYWADPDCSELKSFEGCYGLITYPTDGVESQPYYLGNKNHPGWVSGDGTKVNVLARRVRHTEVVSWDLWAPSNCLEKIPFNSLIMNIFAEYPWQMKSEDGPGSILFIREGVPEFDYIKRLVNTSRRVLDKAHAAAMAVLNSEADID